LPKLNWPLLIFYNLSYIYFKFAMITI